MEKVILTTSQLNQLAFHHPTLAPHFGGTVPCDGLPKDPVRDRSVGFIVNTDPRGQPGRHWLGLWTDGNRCELFDSFALSLESYGTTQPLQEWMKRHFKYITVNGQSVQSLHNQSCGGHALMFLVAKSQGLDMSQFIKTWSLHDYLANDHKVGQWVKALIMKERRWQAEARLPGDQCTSRSRDGVRHLCCDPLYYCTASRG